MPEQPSDQLKRIKWMLIKERRAAVEKILALYEAKSSSVGLIGKVDEITNLQAQIVVIDAAIDEEASFERSDAPKPSSTSIPENDIGFDDHSASLPGQSFRSL